MHRDREVTRADDKRGQKHRQSVDWMAEKDGEPLDQGDFQQTGPGKVQLFKTRIVGGDSCRRFSGFGNTIGDRSRLLQ